MRVVAMTGRARSGKDYALDLLTDVLGDPDGVWYEGFADPIRAAATLIARRHGHEGRFDWKSVEVLPGLTGREFAQLLGTDLGRARDPQLWVRALECRVELLRRRFDVEWLLIADLRFPNEAAWVHQQGGIVVQTTRAPRGAVGGIPGHASEAGIPLEFISYHLDNTQDDQHTTEHWRQILRMEGWL